MIPQPIFIHSLFRAGSTYLFHVFRRSKANYRCYQEPLNELVFYAKTDKFLLLSERKEKMAFLRHPHLSSPYFMELYKVADTCLDFISEKIIYDAYFTMNDMRFINSLIDAAPVQPVIQECRTSGSIGTIKSKAGGFHIYLWRNPWDQWWSYKIDPYFDITSQLFINAPDCPEVIQNLRRAIDFKCIHHGDIKTRMQWFKEHPLTPEHSYLVFYTLWFLGLRQGREHADLQINIDQLGESRIYGKAITDILTANEITDIDFSDCSIPQATYADEEYRFFHDIEQKAHALFLASGGSQEEIDHLQEIRQSHAPSCWELPVTTPDMTAILRDATRARTLVISRETQAVELYREIAFQKQNTDPTDPGQQIQQAKLRAQAAEDKARQAKLEAQQAQTLARQTAAQADLAEETLQSVYASSSWRLTHPLRFIGNLFYTVRSKKPLPPRFIKHTSYLVLNPLMRGIRKHLYARPLIRSFVHFSLKRFPRLKSQLRHLAMKISFSTNFETNPFEPQRIPKEIAHLSPMAKKNYQDLKQAMAQLSKDNIVATSTAADAKFHPMACGTPPIKLSWDQSAQKALTAMEDNDSNHGHSLTAPASQCLEKKKLAFVSPLPPERSGISDYSNDLLPELMKFYSIELIISQKKISDPYCRTHFPIRSIAWFKTHALEYDRIIYQFGNSPFHSHMLDLLSAYPGGVVLHDFYLSDMLAHEENSGQIKGVWTQYLYLSHGYGPIKEKHLKNINDTILKRYPCNLPVLQNALGVVVHSKFAHSLAKEWYPPVAGQEWSLIPLLRKPAVHTCRADVRRLLKIDAEAFVVCSFGMLGKTKLNHRLLNAWQASALAENKKCLLFFVGENNRGEYGDALLHIIHEQGLTEQVFITGWVDRQTFTNYLNAANAGVQLRTMSRGETSAAVLDCMNHGLPTIVNANGSMAELPDDAVIKLPDNFEDNTLTQALETLWKDPLKQSRLGERARKIIAHDHAPKRCAEQYATAIESIYAKTATGRQGLIQTLAKEASLSDNPPDLKQMAQAMAVSTPCIMGQAQLLVDVSTIFQTDLKTGIERVVASQLFELLTMPLPGIRVEPVYLTRYDGLCHYCYARQYTATLLKIPWLPLADEPIDIGPADIFYGLDFCPNAVADAEKAGIYKKWKALGVSINFLVFDLLPVLTPQFFPQGAKEPHALWLNTIASVSQRLICISEAVALGLNQWLIKENFTPGNLPHIRAVHLGADMSSALPSYKAISDTEQDLPKILHTGPKFIMVGTLEPRKGHLQTLEAFEILWQKGMNITLVIVGREGWKHLPNNQRRTIPRIMDKIQLHPERNNHLFWLQDIADAGLKKLYETSTCLIAASEAEGFGLPLIEAAQNRLPVMARDIPVFREVAGDHAFYFHGTTPQELADALQEWCKLHAVASAPPSHNMPWLTWKESARQLAELILP